MHFQRTPAAAAVLLLSALALCSATTSLQLPQAADVLPAHPQKLHLARGRALSSFTLGGQRRAEEDDDGHNHDEEDDHDEHDHDEEDHDAEVTLCLMLTSPLDVIMR